MATKNQKSLISIDNIMAAAEKPPASTSHPKPEGQKALISMDNIMAAAQKPQTTQQTSVLPVAAEPVMDASGSWVDSNSYTLGVAPAQDFVSQVKPVSELAKLKQQTADQPKLDGTETPEWLQPLEDAWNNTRLAGFLESTRAKGEARLKNLPYAVENLLAQIDANIAQNTATQPGAKEYQAMRDTWRQNENVRLQQVQDAGMKQATKGMPEWGKTATQIASGILDSASQAALGSMAGVDPNIIYAAGALADSTAEAESAGASKKDQAVYGALQSALTFATGKLFAAVPEKGDGVVGALAKKSPKIANVITNVTNRITKNPYGKQILDNVFDSLGEGLEEVIQEAATPYMQRLTYDPNADAATVEDLTTAFLLGTLSSMAYNAPSTVSNAINAFATRDKSAKSGKTADTALVDEAKKAAGVDNVTTEVNNTTNNATTEANNTTTEVENINDSVDDINDSVDVEGDLLRASSGQTRDYTVNNSKIGTYLTAAINEESRALGKALGVPYSRRGDFAKERLRELANAYMETGTLDADLALSIFDEAWEQGKVINQDMLNTYQDLKRELQSTKLQITDEVKKNIPDWDNWRKLNRYKVGMTDSGGVPIDQKYTNLSMEYPNLFPEDITDLASQLEKMADVSAELYKSEKSLSEVYGDQTGENYKAMRKAFAERITAFEKKLEQAKAAQTEQDQKQIRAAAPDSVEAAKNAYKTAKQARREYERTLAKSSVLLTDEQKRQVQALAAGKLTANEIPETAAKTTILQLAEIRKRELDALAPLKAYKQSYREGLRSKAAELLEGSYAWKDKASGLQYSRETMERNIRDMVKDRKQADEIISEYFTPVHKSEAARTRFKNKLRDRVRALNLTDAESEAVQYLGEVNAKLDEWEDRGFKDIREKRDYEELKSERNNFLLTHQIDTAKVNRAISEFRSIYNDLFEQMNNVRIRNGYEPVDYRKNYFPHFLDTEPDTLVAKLGAALGIELKVSELPVDIAGRTHTFRPGIQWFGNALQRTTDETVYDAVRGFDSYLEGISNVIYHTDNIQKLRALANEIRYEGTAPAIKEQIDKIRADENISDYERDARIKEIYDDQQTKLSKFVQELEEYTNLLAGKKSRRDRNVEGDIGRKMYDFAKKLNNKVSANMVALNPGSWITNFAPLIQTATQTNFVTMANALKDTVRSYVKDDGFAYESTFLTNRRGSDPLVVDKWEKIGNVLSKPMDWIDHFTSDVVTRARYYDNIKQGMGHQDAIDDADTYAASLIADRSKGALPTIFEAKNPFYKLFTSFQVEVNNQLSWMFKDLPQDERNKGVGMVAWKLLALFVGSYLANDVYEKLRGSRVLFDPLSWVNDAVGDATGYQLPNWVDITVNVAKGKSALPFKDLTKTDQSGVVGAIGGAASNIASEMPFVGGLLEGGRLPISSALPDASQAIKIFDPEVSGAKKRNIIEKEILGKPFAYTVLPFGGGQIKKTTEGVATMLAGGSYTMDNEGQRKLQYPVDLGNGAKDILPWAQAAAFGKSSLPQAKAWVDSGFKTKGVAFTDAYEYLTDEGIKTMDAYKLLNALQDIKKTDDATSTELKRKFLLENDLLTPEQKTKVDQILIDEDKTVDYTSEAAQRTSLATDSQQKEVAEFEKLGGSAEKYWMVYDAFKDAEGSSKLTTAEQKHNVYQALPYKYQQVVDSTKKDENLKALKSYLLQSMPGLTATEKQYLDKALIGNDIMLMERNVTYGDDSSYSLAALGESYESKYNKQAAPAGIDKAVFVKAHTAYSSATWEKGKDGAKSKAIKANIDAVTSGLSKAQKQVLYEIFGVGKSYW